VSAVVAALLALPPALDGESALNGNTALAIISVVSIVFGYVLLAALWRFVFSARARRRRGEEDPPP
jgi:hypothetical protein